MGDCTEHFSFKEFIVSAEHPELLSGITLTPTDRCKLYYLCRIFLEPLRALFGTITILSGKRSMELNQAIGGAEHSDHLFKEYSAAVDFTCSDVAATAAVLDGDDFGSSVGQMIYYPMQHFIHLSLPTPKHKGESLIKRQGKFFPYL